MTLSQTRPIVLSVGQPDHLYEAWEALRLARQIPWCANSPSDWRFEFRFHVSRARNLVEAHANQVDGAEAILTRQGEGAMLRQQIEDHDVLLSQVSELLEGIDAARPGGVQTVVELSERAALVEMLVALHQNRLHRLLGQSNAETQVHGAVRAPALAGRA